MGVGWRHPADFHNRRAAFDFLVATFFGTDRAGRPKGVVEVDL